MLRSSLSRVAARSTSAGSSAGPSLRAAAGAAWRSPQRSSSLCDPSSPSSRRNLSASSSSSVSLAAQEASLHSDRDAALLRQISVGNPQGILAQSLQSSLVHLPLSYLHPSTQQADEVNKAIVPLSAHVFGTQPRSDILHAAVVYYLDSLRAGTASTKTRGEVNYSGRKLRPQKGSGQARLGTRGSPMLRGGGVAHGPKPRDFSTKLPRRVRELALRSALSARWRSNDLHVIPSYGGVEPPPQVTGPMRRLLGSKGWTSALFLTAPRSPTAPARAAFTTARPSAADPVYSEQQLKAHAKLIKNFKIAVGNIPQTEVIELDKLPEEAVKRMLQRKGRRAAVETAKRPGELHAYQVLRYPKLICDLGAIEWLEEKLGGAAWHAALEDASLPAGLSAQSAASGPDAATAFAASGIDEDFAEGAATIIEEVDEVSDETEAEVVSEQEEISREADEVLKAAGVEVDASPKEPSETKQ